MNAAASCDQITCHLLFPSAGKLKVVPPEALVTTTSKQIRGLQTLIEGYIQLPRFLR